MDMNEITKPSIERILVINSTDRQPRNCVIMPPRNGADVSPRYTDIALIPSANPLSPSGKTWLTIAAEPGDSIDEPIPISNDDNIKM